MPVKRSAHAQPNLLLRKARQERGWTQREVADFIGSPQAFLVNRWENGTSFPGPFYRKKLCDLFAKSEEELGLRKSSPQLSGNGSPIYDPSLPLWPSSFQTLVGRDELLQQVRDTLAQGEDGRIVALQGLPGVGKTALAVALATDKELLKSFPAGVLWAGLGPHPQLSMHLGRWGRLLDVSEREYSSLKTIEDWLQVLREKIGTRQVLIVIDDAWSIEDVEACLIGGPGCAYILTTRIPKVAAHFADEHALVVPELSIEGSVRLLGQMVPRLAKSDVATLPALAEAVGGLPLALTLMGTYLLTRSQLSRRIESALAKLQQAEERLNLASPQQKDDRLPAPATVQAVVSLSETVLDESARQALLALSFFPAKPNTFSEEAALSVTSASLETLGCLVDSGLVEMHTTDRYQLHQVIADCLRLRVTEAQKQAIAQRMISYIAYFVEAQQDHYDLLEQELSNIAYASQLAFDYKLHSLQVRIALACSSFLIASGPFSLAEVVLQRAREAAVALGDRGSQLRLAVTLTHTYRVQGKYPQAEASALENLELLRHDEQHPDLLCELLAHLGHMALQKGRYAQAEVYLREGLELAYKYRQRLHLCRLLGLMGIAVEFQGDIERAMGYWEEGLALARQSGDVKTLLYLLGVVGSTLVDYKRYVEAEALLQEGLELARKHEMLAAICTILLDLGNLAYQQHAYDKSGVYYWESVALAEKLSLYPALCFLYMNLGQLLFVQGDNQRAMNYLRKSFDACIERDLRDCASEACSSQGEVFLKQGDLKEAERSFKDALIYVPEGNMALEALAHYGLARVYAALDNHGEARSHGAISLKLFEAAKHPDAFEVESWLAALP